MTPEPSAAFPRLTAFWDSLRASPRKKGAFLYGVAAAVWILAAFFPNWQDSVIADLERLAFDQQMRALRDHHPRALANDVILIGTNDETYRVFDEPFALWHRRFASVMHALAKAKPRAVGVDFVLPERSFEKISPGIDLAMMRGLLDLKRATHLVYVQTVDSQGRLVPVQPNYRAIVTEQNLGVDQHYRDRDSVSRWFGPFFSDDGQPLPSLVSQMLRGLGREADEGFIDYSLGAPLTYVPIHEIPDWDEAKLRATFEGRVVVVGSLVGFVDRWRLPTQLLLVDPGRPHSVHEPDGEGSGGAKLLGAEDTGKYIQPGVLIHVQALRSHLGPGLLHPVPLRLQWTLVAITLLTVLLGGRPPVLVALAAAIPVVLVAAGLASIVSLQLVIPVASLVMAFWLALIVRGVFDAAEAVVERLRLRVNFRGQVSPDVLKEMMSGALTPGESGKLAEVCVLFSDVRDFTTLSENMPPDVVTAVLQRYFDKMVRAVHNHGGTVDKFIGDGMMVLFGAPRKSGDPCGDAVKSALAMMDGLDALNEEFRNESLPVLTIGIGINYGTVTVGYIGSSERHNYSAIGDAVNVAARLEGLTKDLRRKILITEAVVSRIEERFQFDPLGSHKVKGHSPVNVWGIRTVRAAPVAVDAEVQK
jgi:adenylate cyclase